MAWSAPARARAVTSACGPPGGAVAPSKTCDGSAAETTTQPTQGFGAVVPRTESPAAMARFMNASSLRRSSSLMRSPICRGSLSLCRFTWG